MHSLLWVRGPSRLLSGNRLHISCTTCAADRPANTKVLARWFTWLLATATMPADTQLVRLHGQTSRQACTIVVGWGVSFVTKSKLQRLATPG